MIRGSVTVELDDDGADRLSGLLGRPVPAGTSRVKLAVLDDALREVIRRRIREHASPHHVPRVILAVDDVPRTISGKITEIAVRDVVHGRVVRNTDALANPAALAMFKDRPELAGY